MVGWLEECLWQHELVKTWHMHNTVASFPKRDSGFSHFLQQRHTAQMEDYTPAFALFDRDKVTSPPNFVVNAPMFFFYSGCFVCPQAIFFSSLRCLSKPMAFKRA